VTQTSEGRALVQSVARSLAIIETLAGANDLGLVEIAARTDLRPSTAHRLLGTLVARGYAVRSASGRYRLGHMLAELAGAAGQRTERLRALARPHLAIVQRETGETANLSVLVAPDSVYIDQVDGNRAMRMLARIGAAVPAHASAAGKAMLAFAPPGSLHEPLAALTANTITSLAALEGELEDVRVRGYAVDDEEHEPGVGCVAAPVFDHRRGALAALSISAPIQRIHDGGPARLGALLAEQAAALSIELGSS
jgi:IclR family acetate operon transcriptional repressor